MKLLIYKLKKRFIYDKCPHAEAHRWVTRCHKCKYYNPIVLNGYYD